MESHCQRNLVVTVLRQRLRRNMTRTYTHARALEHAPFCRHKGKFYCAAKLMCIVATQVYTFWWTTMANTTSGQIADHINAPSGDLVWWSFTYNQVRCKVRLECTECSPSVQLLTAVLLVAVALVKRRPFAKPPPPSLSIFRDLLIAGPCHWCLPRHV
jgi:hypothetical protein